MYACETGVRVWARVSVASAVVDLPPWRLVALVISSKHGHCAAPAVFILRRCDWSIRCICQSVRREQSKKAAGDKGTNDGLNE